MVNKYHRRSAIQSTLDANKDVPFVRRVNNPEVHPRSPNPDGSVSTHLMSSGEADGKYYAYPNMTVNRGKGKTPSPKGGLKKRDGRDAFHHALKSKNYIEFPTEAEADFFARNYKQVWDK
jgi:hypothetical protein